MPSFQKAAPPTGYMHRSVQTQRSTGFHTQIDSGPHPNPLPSQRQPDSCQAFLLTSPPLEPGPRSHLPSRASSRKQRCFKGLPLGVAACHRGQDPANGHHGCPLTRKLASLCRQGHPKLISQTPPGPCTPFPGTPRKFLGKVRAALRRRLPSALHTAVGTSVPPLSKRKGTDSPNSHVAH